MAFSTMIRTLNAERAELLIDQIELPIAHNDPRFREFSNGTYIDYYGVFSWDEVWELNEKAIADDHGWPGWLKKNIELRNFLEKEKEYKIHMYLIHEYEWESGMGD